MGYWDETYDGRPPAPRDSDLTWGDRPADILGEALDQIIKVFERDLGRRPSEDEVRAGLEFALGGRVFPRAVLDAREVLDASDADQEYVLRDILQGLPDPVKAACAPDGAPIATLYGREQLIDFFDRAMQASYVAGLVEELW